MSAIETSQVVHNADIEQCQNGSASYTPYQQTFTFIALTITTCIHPSREIIKLHA